MAKSKRTVCFFRFLWFTALNEGTKQNLDDPHNFVRNLKNYKNLSEIL